MNKVIIETFNYITICYVNVVESVKLMVQEHYDTPEYNNTIFFINVLPNDTPFDGYLDKQFDKKIYYMLEHKTTDDFYKELGLVFNGNASEKLVEVIEEKLQKK